MITKEIVIDKMEILEDGTIQIREKTRFYEDGVIISETNTDRRVISPGDDVAKETSDIQNIAAIVHTPDKIKNYKTKMKEKIMETFDAGEKEK